MPKSKTRAFKTIDFYLISNSLKKTQQIIGVPPKNQEIYVVDSDVKHFKVVMQMLERMKYLDEGPLRNLMMANIYIYCNKSYNKVAEKESQGQG